jgi:hypothetical protein
MTELSPEEVRARLLNATGFGRTYAGCRDLLDTLGVVQLDPLDRVGTNADLVAFARMPTARLGDIYRETANYGFEHFAKERCLLAPRFWPHYRDANRAHTETGWWRTSERLERVDDTLAEDVLAEVRERGPLTTREMADRGKVEPMDWSGWKGTSSRSALAAEELWSRCALVVSGRKGRAERIYDLPERALGDWASASPDGAFADEMVVERVRSAGVLSRQAGAHWSMLARCRADGTVERLIGAGRLREVRVGKRKYLVEPGELRPAPSVEPVVIGPLDALIWDRELVREAFGFDYLWEVYKPAAKREYGYYVCPVLAGDRLIGRVEAVRVAGPSGPTLSVIKTWGDVPDSAITRLAGQNGAG